MTCIETFATLRIFSTDVHPDEISAVLGFAATRTRPRDPNSKYRHKRENHIWAWETHDHVKSTDNAEHIAAIISQLDGRADALQTLRDKGCEIDICNYWVSTGQGGPSLEPDMMGDLHRLGLPIWWDVYFEEEGEREEQS
jgi:hypothetical protein